MDYSNDNSNNNNNSSDGSSPKLVHTAASSSTYSNNNNNNNSSDASSPNLVHTAASSSTYSNDDNGTPFSDELKAKMKGYLYRNEKASELAQLKVTWMSMPIRDLRTLLGGPHSDIPQDHRTVIQEVLEYKLALAKGRC